MAARIDLSEAWQYLMVVVMLAWPANAITVFGDALSER
jgi:hypothetical protein